MAECHQKLGEAEAQAIYERLVRDYADQKDTARRGALAPRGAKVGGARQGRSVGLGGTRMLTDSARFHRMADS